MAERHVSTVNLRPDDRVVTSDVIGEDFGLALVEPTTRGVRHREIRTVRSVVGGVVRFNDGTKTRRLHGRTAWVRAEP